MALQKLLGSDKLVSKTGEVDTFSIEGKTLMIYFSAHWCPPCRGFTPKLAQFYKELKAKRDDFELVFASSDRDEESFNDYFKESHGDWLALPYAKRAAKEALSKHFKVQGIPTLAVVDKDGNTITTDGRDMVGEDSEGKKFPEGWKPRTIHELLGDAKMTTKDGQPLTADDLKKKDAFALYFSAHWCPPCRRFTPELAATYKKMQAAGQNMEIIFVSSDREEKEYNEYRGEMPWAAMAFKDDAISQLERLCEVDGIPSLATLKGSDFSIINSNARGVASEDEDGTDFPWRKKPLPPCSTFNPRDELFDAINEQMCVVLACDCPSDKKDDAVKAEFTKAAEKFHDDAKAKGEEPDVFFFIVDTDEGKELYSRVLKALSEEEPKEGTSSVLAINFQNNRAKDALSGAITTQSVLDHATAFRKAQLSD